MSDAADLDSLARDYFTEVVQGQHDLTHAFDRFVDLLNTDTEAAWYVACRMLERATDDREVAIVGATALEDVIVQCPGVFVRRAVAEAQQNRRLRKALEIVRLDAEETPKELVNLLVAVRENE